MSEKRVHQLVKIFCFSFGAIYIYGNKSANRWLDLTTILVSTIGACGLTLIVASASPKKGNRKK